LRVAYRRTITRRFTVLRTVTLTVTLTLAIITPPLNIPPSPYGTVVTPTIWMAVVVYHSALQENIERIVSIRQRDNPFLVQFNLIKRKEDADEK